MSKAANLIKRINSINEALDIFTKYLLTQTKFTLKMELGTSSWQGKDGSIHIVSSNGRKNTASYVPIGKYADEDIIVFNDLKELKDFIAKY